AFHSLLSSYGRFLASACAGTSPPPSASRRPDPPPLPPRQPHTRHSRHGLSSRSLERRLRRRNPVVSMSRGRHRRGPPGPPLKFSLPLPLLVPRILADDPHDPAPLDDLAVLAAHLDRRSHFHLLAPT